MLDTSFSETSGEAVEIDLFRIEDAPGIARLFHQVYGEGYPIKTYYSPDRLIEENAAGRVISSVARTAAGEVVGHDALVLLDPAAGLYENGAGAVLPAYRGQGIFPRIFKHSILDASKRFGVESIIGEPVCSHMHVQKMCLQLDFKELGLEVDLMPAAAYSTDSSVSGRVSVLLGCFTHRPGAKTVWIPQTYREQIRYLYAALQVERAFPESTGHAPAEGESRGSMTLFDSAQVARIAVDGIGADFDSFIGRLESDARHKGMEVFHVWLPLTSPFAPAAVDVLRGQGYFLGAVLPCLPTGDGLLMQKLSRDPDWESIALYSERAKRIGEMIKRDWLRAAGT